MDLLLEACDYYLFDRAYAVLLPSPGNSTTLATTPLYTDLNVKVPTALNYVYQKLLTLKSTDVYGEPSILPASPYTYASILSRSNIVRQFISIFLVTCLFGWIAYFSVAGFAYLTVFDKRVFNHPRYLKNQMSMEIHQALTSIPQMVLLTVPFFLIELHGYSRLNGTLYDIFDNKTKLLLQTLTFLMFTDCGIYFIHRWLHIPSVYKKLHKPHHKWIVCTPFASHAFHPVDGWAQSLPYHFYPLFFPLHKVLYLFLFGFVNFWTVMIHDGQYLSNDPVVNGTACHTIHHLYFNYNYGQFTTLWDRLCRSYRRPDDSLFTRGILSSDKRETEKIRRRLEGKDDRTYTK
ncbi:c-5 sterol desaturase [Yamadazyma tenuis]|uniref:Fatty acid hydroxylase domain-containing protein n=1 Tax=Candida tenuis (strain ATCC 10573 / BCRC 21748 / CBS 615 / JCM 9827 / NBRC 10315 / NRRL Y-1498 / VKM Y-70) TaxID=590646 RepID=G3B7T2_CANTC|nr:uncharacterized protein CANTEDRAFT_99337 [Yamadazyma tenuis ATCC 10573]EGV62316.1 hypothetical protein CANTEDRAFT_99337 [Yamadazyma tenuis ATCC 10573]WEJ93574.1 c-5 sterol desaturase [Yamadazyma tenuis]